MIEDDINMVAVAGIVSTGDSIHLSDVEREIKSVVLLGEGRNEEKREEGRGRRPAMGLDISSDIGVGYVEMPHQLRP